MDKELQAALAGEYEPKPFHGATVRIRHLSANQRLDYVEKYGSDLETEQAVEFFQRLIVDCVEGVTSDDVDTIRDSSYPRFSELAQLVLTVNGMGQTSVDEAAKN